MEWPAQAHGATTPKLVLLASPYCRLLEPLSDYIRAAEREVPAGQVVVVISELISTRWYHSFLHNARSTALKAKLYFGGDRRLLVINVPWYLDDWMNSIWTNGNRPYLAG